MDLLMVKIGQPSGNDPRRIDYRPAVEGQPFECFRLGDLRHRVGDAELRQLEQLHFDLVIGCISGRGIHEVDFARTEINPNRWLHIRPGQVHRWVPGHYDATLFVLEPRPNSPHWRSGPRIIELSDDDLLDIEPLVALAGHERRTDVGTDALRTLRDLIVRWLSLDQPDPDGAGSDLYCEFRALLDKDVIDQRAVSYYAAQIGCSPRTLSRACQRDAGRSPKQLIDEAVVLAAQRLLGLPDTTIAQTAEALGFLEPTNFTKFFKRVSGSSPSEWKEHNL